MNASNMKSESFRANWFFIFLLAIFGAVLLATAIGMLVLTITVAFPAHGYTLTRAINVLEWAFGTFATAFSGWAMWIQARQMSHYVAVLDARGVDFRFGSKKNKRDIFFTWDQIAAAQHKRSPAGKSYCIVGTDKRAVEFTIFTFFNPKRLAHQIAVHSNRPIQEIKL
jgi:cytochrome c biogenesis protein CcdA